MTCLNSCKQVKDCKRWKSCILIFDLTLANMLKISPNEECQKIEVLLEKNFDITTEEGFNKIKDNIRYLQRIKVCPVPALIHLHAVSSVFGNRFAMLRQ